MPRFPKLRPGLDPEPCKRDLPRPWLATHSHSPARPTHARRTRVCAHPRRAFARRPIDQGGSILELKHVGKTYADHRVLDDINLTIEDGQILWNGDDITRTPMEKRGFNIVFQACHSAYYAGAKPYLHGSAATSTSSPPAPSTSPDSASLRLAGGHLMITLFSSSSWTSSSAEIEVRARPHATF